MLRINWTHITIETNENAEQMRGLFKATQHTAAAFDTETSGLGHMRDLPFLFQFGWYDKSIMQGYTFAIDLEEHPVLGRQVIEVWHLLVKTVPKYLGHHVNFDLHMLTNLNPKLMYCSNNISDSMAWIRLGTDAISERKGGAPLDLKGFAKQYIDISAKDHEDKLKAEKTKIVSELNSKLRKRLGWTQKKIDAFFKDKVNDADDLPEDKRAIYWEWHEKDLPDYLKPKVSGTVDSDMISYQTLNRKNVIEYGHMDIVWVLEIYDRLREAVELRGNLPAIEREEANIYPVYRMERVGFEVDKDYLLECKKNVKQYIRERRQDLCTIAGREISIGQHALIKEVLAELGLNVQSTGKDELDMLLNKLKAEGIHPVAVDFIEVVQELRTLEKWYSTYIMRFIVDLKYSDKIYTQINLFGTVTGRVTSDFQQFPKDAIKTIDGRELFRPRRLFKVPKDYKGIVYLDYSQIELRLQAMYTLLVGNGGGDLNLCRAYMPYKCFCYTVQELQHVFDPYELDDIKHAYSVDWYLQEQPTVLWTPTDVHGATTKQAFKIDETDERFHSLRYIGKRVNFAKNYGAQRDKIKEMFPEYDDETIDSINDAYYKAFPGVKKYHEYCYNLGMFRPYAQNLYGVRYYNASGHDLINYLIQGTGAYALKEKIPLVDKYLTDNHCKSVLQMQIHDEVSILWHPDDDPKIFFEIKELLQDFPDFIVPIISEMEVTYTTWADKKEVKCLEDLQTAVCSSH